MCEHMIRTGKVIVFFCGLIIGLFLAYLVLGTVISEKSFFSLIMIGVLLFYLTGWLVALIHGKQRLFSIALTIFVGYIIFDGYLGLLFSKFSELTLIVGFIMLAYVGIFMMSKGKKKIKL